MASTESPGVAATMKADKANRESLAKKKSAVKADLQRVTAELEEVEQMKADAEDLEDEELLAEMLSEEQRLQDLKQQYTTELASIQEASQAAAQALRQRFRRITADRALGASGKSTSSESSQPATPLSGFPNPSPSEEIPPSISAPAAATTSADTAPFAASHNSSSVSTAAPNNAQFHADSTSYAGPSTMSNMPLSASWGAAPAPAQMSMPAQSSQQPYGEYAQHSEPQRGQQEPQYRSFESAESFLPQQPYSAQTADSTAYHPAVSQAASAEYSQNSYPTDNSTSAYMPSTHAQEPEQAVHDEPSSLDASSPAALEQEADANNIHLPGLNQELPGESTPGFFRGQSDLASKPPRPASSFATQQGDAKASTYGLPLSRGLHDQTSSKASMMSAGSGYQADSDSNSDVQLEPQTSSSGPQTFSGSQQGTVSSGVPQHESADAAPPPESSAAEAEADKEAEAEDESEAKSGTSTSLLGKLGNTVWGAVEAITGHQTDSTAAEKEKTTAEDHQQLQAEPLAKASGQESQPKAGTAAEEEAAGDAQLTQADSGYEAGEEGPVQAGPEGTFQHSPDQEAEPEALGIGSVPSGFGTSFMEAQTQPSSHWTSYAEPQLASESAAESGAQSEQFPSFQEPLHVQTDAASSKRGAGDDQPGSASKRARGGSAVAGLINTFDSPRSEARSPSVGSYVSGSAATRTYFTTPQDIGSGFTQGTSPTKGRATSSSPFSATTTFQGPQSESLGSALGSTRGSGALPEEDSYQQSTRASQGSLDTTRDNLGSVSSIGGQAELNNELNFASQTRGLSGALPESAANLAQAGVSTTGHDTVGGSSTSITAVGSEGVPIVAAPLTNAPPSANWGSATSYEPTIMPPTVVATQQGYGSSVSEPYQGGDALSQVEAAQHDFTSGSQGLSAQQGYEPELSPQSVNTTQEASIGQDSEFSSFEPSSAYGAQATGPASVASQRETVVPSSYTAEGPGRDTSAASEYNTAVPTTYSSQESTLGAPASATQYDRGMDAFAQSQPEATSTFSTQGATATPVAQDTSAGFGDDAFAQFSPFGQKAKQQVSPFGQQAEAQPTSQAGFDGQEVPFEPSGGQTAAGTSQMTEPVPQGIKAQVTPTSVTGTFTERSPFQSTRPSDLSTQRLDSQQSLGGSSYNEFGAGTGKAASPRRRPPPPPAGGSAFGRTTSGLPLSPTQGSLQRLPSDAFAEVPSHSRAPFTDPVSLSQAPTSTGLASQPPSSTGAQTQPSSSSGVSISTGLAPQPPISTGAQTQMPPSTGVSTIPVTTGRMSVMPTGAGTMIQEGEVVPVPPPVSSPVTQAQGADSGLFVGKTAFDNAVEPVPEPVPRPGVAQGSAFSKAAGTGPAFDTLTPKARAAVMSEPLASWTSFEDPGPLPPMPAPTPDDDPSDEDIFARPVTTPATATTAQPPAATTAATAQPSTPAAASAPASQASKQRSNDPWATPVEPPPEVKAAENELLSATLAGLGGDAWGNSFGPEMGKPLKGAGAAPQSMAAAAQVPQESAAAKPQPEPLMTQPSWMQMANSSNPFASFLPADTSANEPNPWATSAPQEAAAPNQQAFPSQPMGSSALQPGQQQAPQQASFGNWDSFNSAAPVAYPAVDDNRHPDVVPLSGMGAAPTATPQQQQQYPSPPSGPGAQQAAPAFGQDWAAFGPSGQAPQQPTGDLWTMDAFDKPQQQQPRAAIVDSWASFDAPSEQGALGGPMASQQASQGISNINSQDSWSAFDPGNNTGNNTGARSGGAAAGFPAQSSAPSSASSQQARQGQTSNGYGGVQPTSPSRENFIEEIPVQAMGLDPSLTITAKPKDGMAPSQGQYDYPQQATGQSEGYGSQPQGSQPLPKPKRGSSAQFGSVFSPGSANSVSKLTNMFKKDKKGTEAPASDPYSLGQTSGLPPAPNAGGGGGASLPPTPRGRTPRGAPPKGQGGFSEVDLWRPQSAEERQQCMNAFDQKGFGRLGGLGEVDARALWTRQNMPADMFHQVWSLSDMDNNQLLSKPEFCLFMYLMHAIRNFGTSFRLPDQITPNQAARVLGLEQMVRPSASGSPAAGGRDQAVSSSQGYSPNGANGAAGSQGQGPQQYRQQGPQQTAPQDWEATGGLSPSQQQAVQELTDMGFDPRQSQEALEAHTWNRNAAANWLLQGGSNQPQGPALRRSTTDRSSNAPSLGSGGGSGFGSQSMRSSGGSGVGRYSHGHNSSAGSAADWGSGNYSPTSAGGMSQPGSARTTGDSVSGADFGTPRSRGSRMSASGNARLSLTVRKVKMDYKGIMEKPFFTLSVRARGGTLLEQSQDTPPGAFSRGIMISDETLVLATPISELPQGAVLFFELKHWKPKEKKFSLRGWALVAVSSLVDYSGSVPQLQTGTMKLSMLQKPVDLALSRKHRRLSPEGFDLEVNVNMA